jgi:hypothetical protein
MSHPEDNPEDNGPELVSSMRVAPADASLDHLAENRGLVVRRSLLAAAVGGVVPIPVLDEYLAGRVKAGMLMKLAERRHVDLAQSSAELLGDPREGTAVRNATLTAATLLALKLAWKKFFAVLAIGRRAEEMATSFQLGMLFDHYCAKIHVGGEIDRLRADELRIAIHGALSDSEREGLVTAFREGAQVLGRSILEAPTWVSGRVERAAQHWANSGGRTTDSSVPGAGNEASAEVGGDEAAAAAGSSDDARWLDKAAAAVESRLGRAGQGYLSVLVRSFERRWKEVEARRKAAPTPDAGPPGVV